MGALISAVFLSGLSLGFYLGGGEERAFLLGLALIVAVTWLI